MTAKRAKKSTTSKKKKPTSPASAATGARARNASARATARSPAAARAHKSPGAAARAARKSTPDSALLRTVIGALDELKALDVKSLDVRGLTDITDTMVVASGTSDRHVRSIADRVVQRCKEAGFRPYGLEGERDGEWVLLDLNDIVLHVMLPRVREFYALEKLWAATEAAA